MTEMPDDRKQEPGGHHLLLVDDEEANRLRLGRCLEQAGHTVALACDGREAVQMLRLERFDGVLLDIYMPELDGLGTLDAIRSDPRLSDTPVVMITASNSRQHVVHCLSLGATDYIIKPVSPTELQHRVRRCIGRKAVRMEPTVDIETSDSKGARVLVVDDEPLNTRLLESRLRHFDFRPLTAAGGPEALQLLAQRPVDAVLLDIDMPGMDGLSVLTAIRADPRSAHVPVLMLSAADDDGIVMRAFDLGASDYLNKPCHPQELNLRLSVAIAVARAHAGPVVIPS